MNKNTLVLLAVVVGLGITAYIVTKKPDAEPAKAIAVPGYAPQDKLDERAKQGIMDTPVQIDYPVDEVIYTYEGTTVRMVREGDGKDATWLIKEPVDAVAVKYQVDKMIKPFETKTASITTKTVSEKNYVRFDLEPENRVTFTLKAGGNVWNGVDFVVGKVAKSEGGGQGQQPGGQQGDDADTWVMKKGEDGTVYRVAGKDLRTPFELKLSDLRDKKVFTAKATDLVKVEIKPPSGDAVVLTGDRKEEPKKEEPPKPDGSKPDKPKKDEGPKFKVTWTLTAPAGVKGDKAIDAVARSVANLRTREFVEADKGPKEGLGKEVWTVTATSHDNKTYAVNISAGDTDDDKVWAQVAGKKEWLKLDKYAAKNLRKSLADLKDKALFGDISADDITMLETAPDKGPNVRVAKKDGKWVFVAPIAGPIKEGVEADPASVLRTIATAKATRYATAAEAEAAKKALEKPEFTAQLTAKGKTWMVKVGPKMEEGDLKNQRWAMALDATVEGATGEAVLLQDFTAKRFRKSVDDLRRKKLFDFKAADIAKMSVKWPDGKTTVGLEKAADGKLTPTDLPAGKKAKPATVTTVSNTLANLRAKAFITDEKAAELGLTDKDAYVVTAALADGKELKLLISKKTEGTDPYATVNFGGLAGLIFTLNKYQVDNLQKAPKDFVE